jgi:GPI mannosyltransferase 3
MTFTPLNFLRANLAVSSFYGVNQWHYYFTQALPILCTTTLPFVLHGAYGLWRSRDPAARMMIGLVIWTIGVYSLSTHKEWRFLHPLLPLMHICAAKSLVDLHASHVSGKQSAIPIRRSHIALLALNIPAIMYVLLLHGRAQISVMHHLRGLPSTELDSLGVLAPCHSTPWQAYLHRPNLVEPGQLWAIGCEPPLGYGFIQTASYE